MSSTDLPPVALVTYSTKPRGGVVHTLALGEALHRLGVDVLVVGLGDPKRGFFRPTDVPTLVIDAPEVDGGLEERVAANIDALEAGLGDVSVAYPLVHTQDCIAARAAARVRDAAAVACLVLRTVHHVDDFTSQILMDCQREAILEPDRVFVVSRTWQEILQADYGIAADVVPNGVDVGAFAPPPPGVTDELRARVGATGRPLLLSVGGIEPRKGSDTLVRALAQLVRTRVPAPVLAVLGGHSFQDHRAYKERVLESLGPLGLVLGTDVVEVGTVPAEEMAAWYHAGDAFAFPSVKEGFGLAALEAMAAGLPVVASDLPAFREWLVAGRDALVVPVGDDAALAGALDRVLDDAALRDRLVESGRAVAQTYSWEASALRHVELYTDTWARAEAGAGS